MTINRKTPLSLAAALIMAYGLPAVAQETATPVINHDTALERQLSEAINPKPDAHERDRLALVEAAISDGDTDGAWEQVKGRDRIYLTARDVALRVLEKNLTLKTTEETVPIALAALRESKALFDPVLSFSIQYNFERTYDRSKYGLINKKNFMPFPQHLCVENAGDGQTSECPNSSSTSPRVVALGFLNQPKQIGVPQQIFASKAGTNEEVDSFDYTLSISQLLPWGPSLALTHTTHQEKIYYRTGMSWADGDVTSDLTISFSTPLPFTEGFGPAAYADTQVRRNEISITRAEWAVKSQVNTLLLLADMAWWNLVENLESLRATEKNVDLTRTERDRVRRMFDKGYATRFDKAQADAALVRAEVDLEAARSAYLAASQVLGELVENKAGDLKNIAFLPIGWNARLTSRQDASKEDVFETARANRPDMHLNALDRELFDIDMAFAENQDLPTLVANGSVTFDQNHDTYGFRDVVEAVQMQFRPDKFRQNYTLTYVQALNDRIDDAAVDRARLTLADQDLNERVTDGQAKREIRNALTQIETARAQETFADRESERLTRAHDGLIRQRDSGQQVTQDEITRTLRNLLAADLNLIRARIDNKRGETLLMAAQGILPSRYAMETAASEYDRDRITRLADAGIIEQMAPMEEQ
ncbi:MAG: TolC family protein [Pseudomonadota bacterium]|nr:TolC family protein [Pseudomonadota bacterium]